MSIYDEERQKLGIKTVSKSDTPKKAQQSKSIYDDERVQLGLKEGTAVAKKSEAKPKEKTQLKTFLPEPMPRGSVSSQQRADTLAGAPKLVKPALGLVNKALDAYENSSVGRFSARAGEAAQDTAFIREDSVKTSTGNKTADWIAEKGGNLLGYFVPGGAGAPYMAAEKVLASGVTKTLGRKAATLGAAGVASGATRGVVQGEDAAGIAKEAAIEGGLSAGGGALLHGAGKLVGKATAKLAENKAVKGREALDLVNEAYAGARVEKTPNNLRPKLQVAEKVPKRERVPDSEVYFGSKYGEVRTPDSPVALLPAGPSFKTNRYTMDPFIRRQAEQFRQAYDEGITAIQNEYGHWDLRPQDVLPTAQKAGVNLEELLSGLQRAENPLTTRETLGNIANRSRMERVVGLKPVPNITKPERLGYYGVKNGAVMQNKGLTRSLPTIPTDRGVKLAPQLPKAEPQANLLPKLPKANAGANGGQLNTIDKIVSGKQANSTSLWEKLNNLYTRTVDTQRPIGRFSKDAKAEGLTPAVLASNSRNAPGITSYIFENGLVNKEGQKIGESYKELLKSIPKDGEKEVADYLLHRHNVARMAQGKPVFGEEVTADISMTKVAEYEALHPEYKQLGDRLNGFIDSTMKAWGVDTGLLTKEQYAAMKQMYPDYVPTFRSFSELEKAHGLTSPNTGRGKSFVGRTAGIKSATGSDRPVIDPLESIMGLVDKTVKAAKYNEVGQSVVNAIKENPEGLKRWAEIVPSKQGLMDDINKVLQEEGIEGVMSKFNEQFDRAFNKTSLDKDNVVRVMVEGQPVYLQINDKSFLDAVKGLTQSDTGAIEKAFRKGTGVFKALITGKNPLFAIKNIARDIPTSYVSGSEKNPAKFLVDLLSAGKDIVTKNAQFQEYRALGGGQGNFFAQDTNLLKSGGSLPGKTVGKIEAFNNLTESVPRYAEYKRTAKLGGGDYAAKQQGIFNANEVTTNFGRHGDLTKSVDSFVPYLNPAVQGIDKTIRQFKNHPIATILKGATIVTAPTLILSHANKDNPHYKALDNRTKDNYFLIPNNSDKDENGNAKTFIKLPKSRELGVLFGSLTERTLRATAGESESFKGYGNTVATNFSPSNPIESNIFSPLAYNIPKNKDFANRTIVPQSMQDRSPKYQYDDQTSEIAKKIGGITNMSPKQIDYLISSYTGVIGQFVLPATTKSNYQSGNTLQKGLKPITKQFTADPLYSNSTINDFYDNYDKLKQLAADKNFVDKIPSKAVTPEERLRNAYLKASKEMSALNKQIKEEDIAGNSEEVKRLRRQIIDIAGRTNQLMPK